jgi:type IV secretion system protein VirD4
MPGVTDVRQAANERAVRAPPYPHGDRPLVFLLALGLMLAAGTGTQYVAWRLGFHPSLGPPIVVLDGSSLRLLRAACVFLAGSAGAAAFVPRLGRAILPLLLLALCAGVGSLGPIHAPHRIFVWHAAFADVPAAAPIFRVAWTLGGAVGVAVSIALTSSWRRRRLIAATASHGSAHWGDGEVLHRDTGLLLGRKDRHLLRYAGEGHVLTVAPTRSGKGVGCVIPNLLDHPGSVLVIDPKGENFAVTSRWRREMGQGVHAFDPFGLAASADVLATYNPLDLIDPEGPEAVDDARTLADMIVLPEGREGEQTFWNEEARGVLSGLILHVATNAPIELRTLAHVRTLLTLAPGQFAELLKEMQASSAAGGLVARAAARVLQKAEKERSGVISTAQSHTHFLDSPRMARVLGSSSIDLSVLKRDVASVYLILPTDRLDAYARWLRLMIACVLLAIARARGQPRERVLFLLDEFAHLGRMHPVQRDIGLAGGFGVAFWLVVQDFSQLRSAYGEGWSTFLSNVDVLQAFGANDWDTAEYLSKMTGESTIHVESENRSSGISRGRQSHRQVGAALSTSEKGRRLLFPDEVRRLPADAQLLFVKGSAPLLVQRLNYLRDREFLGRADPNPLYEPVASVE